MGFFARIMIRVLNGLAISLDLSSFGAIPFAPPVGFIGSTMRNFGNNKANPDQIPLPPRTPQSAGDLGQVAQSSRVATKPPIPKQESPGSGIKACWKNGTHTTHATHSHSLSLSLLLGLVVQGTQPNESAFLEFVSNEYKLRVFYRYSGKPTSMFNKIISSVNNVISEWYQVCT